MDFSFITLKLDRCISAIKNNNKKSHRFFKTLIGFKKNKDISEEASEYILDRDDYFKNKERLSGALVNYI